ncbi:MAG: Holliday junction resolvase RuvX [Planctomycetota bacterium]|nr:Holliday junction resolvase RuvX [Planctomycetota bacterium]
MRILGLDLGERRVGVAISDPEGILAQPLVQLEPRGRRDLVAAVARLVAEHGAGRVVVGMPFLPDGARGEQARRAVAVAAALRQEMAIPIVEWDERFSTEDAQEKLREAGVRPRRRQGRLDMAAATVILQSYLDAGAPL